MHQFVSLRRLSVNTDGNLLVFGKHSPKDLNLHQSFLLLLIQCGKALSHGFPDTLTVYGNQIKFLDASLLHHLRHLLVVKIIELIGKNESGHPKLILGKIGILRCIQKIQLTAVLLNRIIKDSSHHRHKGTVLTVLDVLSSILLQTKSFLLQLLREFNISVKVITSHTVKGIDPLQSIGIHIAVTHTVITDGIQTVLKSQDLFKDLSPGIAFQRIHHHAVVHIHVLPDSQSSLRRRILPLVEVIQHKIEALGDT